MRIEQPGQEFPIGYTPITEQDGRHADMLMDFGILKLRGGESYRNTDTRERAFLLMDGDVEFVWSNGGLEQSARCARSNILEQEPFALHVPSGVSVELRAHSAVCEVAVQATRNPRRFEPRLWRPGEYRSEEFGKGTLQDTSTRRVRTIFDAATAPESAMVLGEVINFPGKWSSYPPHTHAQPEIYHFRFFPRQGFGFSEQGEQVYRVRHCDTVTIEPFVTHPQTAAPGYAMYYIWMIPHLPNDRFGPDSRIFEDEHRWVMDASAPIWPDADLSTVMRNSTQKG